MIGLKLFELLKNDQNTIGKNRTPLNTQNKTQCIKSIQFQPITSVDLFILNAGNHLCLKFL